MTSTHRWLADEATRAGILIVADQPRTDHPHARGENEYTSVPILISNGPSPRTWGERPGVPHHCAGPRTIPTHVGRTPPGDWPRTASPDHPHARGENPYISVSSCYTNGQSPRTWGEPIPLPTLRTIPTHVGRTCRVGAWGGPSPRTWGERSRVVAVHPDARLDHPHARGENGSARVTSAIYSIRTIPTHVGRTRATSTARSNGSADHPHARGENAPPRYS